MFGSTQLIHSVLSSLDNCATVVSRVILQKRSGGSIPGRQSTLGNHVQSVHKHIHFKCIAADVDNKLVWWQAQAEWILFSIVVQEELVQTSLMRLGSWIVCCFQRERHNKARKHILLTVTCSSHLSANISALHLSHGIDLEEALWTRRWWAIFVTMHGWHIGLLNTWDPCYGWLRGWRLTTTTLIHPSIRHVTAHYKKMVWGCNLSLRLHTKWPCSPLSSSAPAQILKNKKRTHLKQFQNILQLKGSFHILRGRRPGSKFKWE